MPNPDTMQEITCKLLVIGAGPGGYVTAIRAGQLGIDTVIVEGRKVGGTCLTVGCIPSKALIHAAEEFERISHLASGDNPLGIAAAAPTIDLARTIQWKDEVVSRLNSGVAALLKKARVKIVTGHARFVDGRTVAVETDVGTRIVRAEAVVIATGSEPVELPFLPFGGDVISSTGALALTEVPKRLAIIGGGYIGLELGTAFAKLGSRVTVVEAAARILPQYDAELTRPVAKRLKDLDITVLTDTKARGLDGAGRLLVEAADGTPHRISADKILVTVGRRPVTEGWGREELLLDMDGRFLRIDSRCQTSMRGIYAIGDVTGEPMLAHRAMAQGEMVAEIIAGHKRQWDRQAIPAVCFTDPEIVTVGLSPDEARASQGEMQGRKISGREISGREIKVGTFPFSANGRAMTKLAEDGFVRVTARADNHVVLGIQAVGAGISELAAAFGLALEMGARLDDIAATIHAHPTQGEALQEAALRALGRAIHV